MAYVFHLELKSYEHSKYGEYVFMDIYRNPPTKSQVTARLLSLRSMYPDGSQSYDQINWFLLKVIEFGIPAVNEDAIEFISKWNGLGFSRILRYEVIENE